MSAPCRSSCRSGAVSAAGATLLLVAIAGPARADDGGAAWGRRSTAAVSPAVTVPPASRSDGVYGRFEGDLDLGVGIGGEADRDATRGALRLDLHYFSMAGIYVTGSDSLGRDVHGDARVLALGVDVRPGFVPRWAKGMEQGPAFVDLIVDSISLGAGAFWSKPNGGTFGQRRGFEASLGFGLPLAARGPGPWLETRGMLRWPDAVGVHDARIVPGALVVFAWHASIVSPLARDPELL